MAKSTVLIPSLLALIFLIDSSLAFTMPPKTLVQSQASLRKLAQVSHIKFEDHYTPRQMEPLYLFRRKKKNVSTGGEVDVDLDENVTTQNKTSGKKGRLKRLRDKLLVIWRGPERKEVGAWAKTPEEKLRWKQEQASVKAQEDSPVTVEQMQSFTFKKSKSKEVNTKKKPAAPRKRKPSPINTQVAVVGAGLSGLSCALQLAQEGVDVVVLEGSDRVGGRVCTDYVDGFLLDRGFQVFIEGYPEVQRLINFDDLKLQRILPGAMVYNNGSFDKICDPFRRPSDVVEALVSPVGTLVDKARVGVFRSAVLLQDNQKLMANTEYNTEGYLVEIWGFSSDIMDKFFRPFLQGVFLAPLRQQSSQMFDFIFKVFSQSPTSLPAGGMSAVPVQLASKLPKGALKLNSPVEEISKGVVTLKSGQKVICDDVVVATDPITAGTLLENKNIGDIPKGRGVSCIYYTFEGEAPIKDKILILNGEETTPKRPVNNMMFLSEIAPSYAPEGQCLVSTTVVGQSDCTDSFLEAQTREHLTEWYGDQVKEWRHLRTYRIPYAQPTQRPPNRDGFIKKVEIAPGIYCIGDHRDTPTVNGAVESGTRAARTIISRMAEKEAKKRESEASVPAA